MAKKTFDLIAAGLTEALSIAKGERKPARLYVPQEIDVRSIRGAVGMSQEDFAAAYGFTSTQIKDWEQRRSRPLGGVRAYLMMIRTDPVAVLNILRSAAAKHKTAA